MHSANHIYPEGMFCRTLSPIRPLEPCPQNPYPRRPYSLGSGPPAMFTGYVVLLLDSRQPMSHTLNSDDLWTTCYNIQKLLSQGERINEFGGLSTGFCLAEDNPSHGRLSLHYSALLQITWLDYNKNTGFLAWFGTHRHSDWLFIIFYVKNWKKIAIITSTGALERIYLQRFWVKCGLLGSEAGMGRPLDLGRMFVNSAKMLSGINEASGTSQSQLHICFQNQFWLPQNLKGAKSCVLQNKQFYWK